MHVEFLDGCVSLFEMAFGAKEPRDSFKSMDRGSAGHGLPALATHSGYVEELLSSLDA